ncbi:MAG: helix-turn-helix domain-containing protein [Bacillota bacterium]|nr:helix-turn-helix domain-containing protein [Bacillota bacterium]
MAKGKYEKWLTPDGLLLLEAWARDGLTDEQIAHNCGVRRETLIQWKKQHPNISNALKKGKEIVDIEIENALLKRAKGYRYTEVKVKESPDGTEITTTTKEIPPDVGAAFIWLKNRKPDVWRDKPTTDNREVIDKLDNILGGIDVIANE